MYFLMIQRKRTTTVVAVFFSVSLFIVIDVVYSLVAVFIESYTFIY